MTDLPKKPPPPTPAPTPPPLPVVSPGTIDITNVVSAVKDTFVTVAVNALFALAVGTPGLGWLGFPIISGIVRAMMNWGVSNLAGLAEMQAFFENTIIRKAGQAQDYVAAVSVKNALPKNVSDAEYEQAELAEIAAFRNFVKVTN
jgi:hypothetical protein